MQDATRGKKSGLAMQDYLQRYPVQVYNTVKYIKFQAELDFRVSPGPLFLPTILNMFCYRVRFLQGSPLLLVQNTSALLPYPDKDMLSELQTRCKTNVAPMLQ